MASPIVNADNPWPWLDPYTEGGAANFFNGREDDTAQMDRLVRGNPATVLFGKSGLGKTSLLQAGLFPRLRAAGLLPVLVRLKHEDDALPIAEQVYQRLHEECSQRGLTPPGDPLLSKKALPEPDRLWFDLHTQPLGARSADGTVLPVVLVFDQFEEVFTLGSRDPDRLQQTFGALGDLVENRIPLAVEAAITADEDLLDVLQLDAQPYRVVLSLREDFLPDLERWADRIPRLGPNRYRLLPMRQDQAMAATLKTGGALVSKEAASNIVQFVGSQNEGTNAILSVEPALLSLLCSGLNQERQSKAAAQLDASNLDKRGGEIIEHFYDEAVAGLTRATVDWVEDELITPDGVRLLYPLQSALRSDVASAEVDTLVNRRLLRKEALAGGSVRVELVHDRLAAVARKRREERKQELERSQLAEEFTNAKLRQLSRRLQMAVFGLIVLFGMVGWFDWQAQIQFKLANMQRDIAIAATKQAKANARDATVLRSAVEGRAISRGDRSGGPGTGLLLALAAHRIAVNENPKLLGTTFGALQGEASRTARLLHLMEGRAQVATVAFSPDGRRIVSGSLDNTLRLWDAISGAPIGEPLEGHTGVVTSVAFSPDGRLIVSGSADNTLRLWNAASGAPVATLKGHTAAVFSIAFSPDGMRIVSGSADNSLRQWRTANGTPVGKPLRAHTNFVTSVSFSPDGQRIVSGSVDKTLRLWSTASGTPVGKPLRAHTDSITSVAFSPDGRRIISGSSDKTLRFWNSSNRAPIGKPLEGHTGPISCVTFSFDGRRIASSSEDNTLRLWSAASGAPIGETLKGHTDSVSGVAFSPDGQHVVSGSLDSTLRLWDATDTPIGATLKGHTDFVSSVAYSPNGKRIVSGSGDNTLRLWDAASGTLLGASLKGHTAPVSSVAFSPDGWNVASGSLDNTLHLWNIANGISIRETVEFFTNRITSVTFSPDGQRIAFGSSDKTLRIWDTARKSLIGEPLKGHTGAISSVAFSPDGLHIVSGSLDKTLRIWDTARKSLIGEPLKGHIGAISSVAFSPDSLHIISGSFDNTLRLWDSTSGASIGEPFKGHVGGVTSVAFSPDGRHVVSGSTDNTLRLWDVASGALIGEPLKGHTNSVNGVAFSPDGQHIVSGSSDTTLRLWSVLDGWADALCAKLSRNMSAKEWKELVSPDIAYVKQCPDLPIPADPVAPPNK